MTDDLTGYAEAAEVLNTRQDDYEEADNLTKHLPDGFRSVEVYPSGGGRRFAIERETTHAPKWVPVARFTCDDAVYEWAEEIADGISDGYRCVLDYDDSEVWLEARINPDE